MDKKKSEPSIAGDLNRMVINFLLVFLLVFVGGLGGAAWLLKNVVAPVVFATIDAADGPGKSYPDSP